MPIVLSVAERNDAATTDAAGTAQSGVQGIARASRSSTGTGTWFQGTYGALLLNSDGSFIYRLDHQDPDTNALGAGQTADDRFTYTYLQNGIVRTDTITIRVAGIDEADQQVTSGGTVAYTDDATVDAHRQIRIDDHAVTLTAGEDDHVVLTNHGMIRANAIGSEAIGVQVTVDFPWTGSATLVNRGLIESYVGPASHLAYGVNASTGPAFDNAVVINHGVIRAISEATGTSYSQVYGAASANLVNTGTVEAISTGEVWATYVGTYGSLDNQGFIYAQGATAEYAHGIAGVRVGQASRVTISNSGTIHAVSLTAIESIGIVMFRDSTNHYAFARVDNSGTIVADIAIKAYATSVGGITGVHAYNSGRVEGDFDMDLGLNLLFNQAGGTWIGDIRGGINEDAVRNRGLIDGMVALGDGHDLFDGRGGVQTGAVSGGAGNDTLLGSDGSDDLSGGDGIDYIAGGGGADSLAGGAGGDVFSYHAVGDSSSGAFDTIADFVSGTDWIDLSALSPSSVTLAASGGFTMVNAVTAAGTVTIRVGGTIAVSDVITAPRGAAMTGTGADEILFATLAGSQLNGAGGNDVLEGSIGADLLDGGAGSDQMRGGAGNDVYFADAYEDRIVEFGGEGVDELRTSASQRLQAYVENLTMLGGAHIFASGNDLANVIIGNSGWNEIIGEGGDDVITGGGGADTLGGGDGRDVFVYLASSDSVSGASDQLSDFRTGDDRIDLRAVAPTSVSLQETMLGYWQGFAISNVATIQTASGTMTIRVTGKLFLSDFILGNEIVGTPVADSLAGDEDGNVILGGDGDDSIIGLAGMDTLAGQDGNDRLDGGTGADQMTGGRGDDVYIVDDSGDYVWEKFAEGYDVLIASTSFTLGQQVFVERLETANAAGTEAINLTGNTKDNLIIGNAGNNILDGGRTNDPLGGEFGGRDRFIGYGGDDVFIVDGSEDVVVEAAGGGRDTVIARNSYVLTAGAEVEILKAATDAFNPIDLTGNEFAQSIWAGATLNNLDGRGGADSFVFASVADSTSEQTDRIRNFQSGIDRIDLSAIAPTSVTWVSATDASDNSAYNLVTVQAPSGTMTLRVYGSLALADFILQPPVISGTANDDVLVGTAGDDELRGLAGNDSLDGRAGADLMVGGIGNDVFLVDNAGDMASEAAGEGVDLVESSIGFALGDEVENLTLTGSAAINGTGNALANAITGNEAANVLDGGTDNDRLIGGLGADQLIGGLGDDTFVFDTVDSIVENAGGGTDTVESAFTYTLPDNIENLVLTGGSAIDGTGNSLVNSITGNGAANRLDGGLGADVMNGGGGSDTFIVDNVGDTIVEAVVGGTDTAESSVSYTIGSEVERLTLTGTASINGTGNGLANIVTGNSGDNVLDGGVGTDLMIGGLGNDTFVVDNGGDSVSEQNGSGTDTVRSAINYTLGDWVENLVLLAGAATGTGNGLANGLTGNDAANTLDGKGGADGMAGGLGDDLYIIDNVGDLATEATSAGTDSVQSSVSFTLGANVEHLVLLAGALNGTGNGLANAITGNGANNMLNGMGGADILSGGLGHDTYIVDNASDVIVEAVGGGNDSVQASTTYTLGDNVEYLTLTGTASISATGNALNNVINGNSAANFIVGGLGADFMTGNGGDDTYFVDNASDKVFESAGGGTDTVSSGVNWTLGAEVERLVLTGTLEINGIGNDLANIITGNGSANRLDGGIGADTMQGGLGNDTYIIDNVGDVATDTGGLDTVQSSVTVTLHASIDNLILTGANAIDGTGNGLWNVMTGNGAANTLDGGIGNDILNGGLGADTLIGGAGHDTYHVDNVGDQVIDTGGGNDHVHSSISYTLGTDLEYLTLTGTAVSATGNAKNNLLYGNAGNNVIDGGLGADTMVGGNGDDVYYVENGSDQITEHLSQGNDTVMSSVHHALRGNIENLTLIGTNAVSATGNELANVITGNSASNVISGGLGADTLSGGGGNDIYQYRFVTESTAASKDQISGFNAGDRINLSILDANTGTSANNDAFTFIGSNAFSNVAGELRATESGGVWTIQADVNGDGIADLTIGLTTEAGYLIGAGDFML